jgi:hypothetical protein
MHVEQRQPDQSWDERVRHETVPERLDRNWAVLLQELRVAQTGVQLLTGFLLTLPFQQRFDILSHGMRLVYLATVACSVGSTVLLIAPVGMHRLLFRRHRLDTLVTTAHICAIAGLGLLGAAIVGVTTVIFFAVAGPIAGRVAGVIAAIVFGLFWAVLPLWQRRSGDEAGVQVER